MSALMSANDPKRTFWRCFGENGMVQLLRAMTILSDLEQFPYLDYWHPGQRSVAAQPVLPPKIYNGESLVDWD